MLVIGSCLVWVNAAASQAMDSGTNGLELIPEDNSLWKESMLWDKDIILRTGFGYKDNVLLSPVSRQGSGFLTTGLDLTIVRLPLDGWEVNFSVVGDDVRYFRRPGGLAGEDLFIASAQVQRYFPGAWQSGLEIRYTYADQVLQQILMAGGVRAVEAKGNTVGARPFIRRELSTNWWVQFEAPMGREWWQSPLDPTWKIGGQMIIGLSYAPHSQVSLTGGGVYVHHDQWLARDETGAELPGRLLEIWKEVAELRWDHRWDSHNRWSSSAKLGFNHAIDNGGGFYDFYRYYASGEIRFKTKDWELKGAASVSYYDFPVQTIDIPPSPKLHLTTIDCTLRAERRLYRTLRSFAAFEYEQTASNDPLSEYRNHTVVGGVSWEF